MGVVFFWVLEVFIVIFFLFSEFLCFIVMFLGSLVLYRDSVCSGDVVLGCLLRGVVFDVFVVWFVFVGRDFGRFFGFRRKTGIGY